MVDSWKPLEFVRSVVCQRVGKDIKKHLAPVKPDIDGGPACRTFSARRIKPFAELCDEMRPLNMAPKLSLIHISEPTRPY